MPRHLLVIDGADEGRAFALPVSGMLTLGSSHRHANIALNDLYVSRVHCELRLEGDRVHLSPMDGAKLLVNNAAVDGCELRSGDVLRIGNSHLRLQDGDAPAAVELAPEPLAFQPKPGLLRAPDETPLVDSVQIVGHYRLGELLGEGHFGSVFHAVDVKTGHAVALKLLATEFPANEAEMKRFTQVMKVALPLRHPNLVAVYGVGRSGQQCWLVRELVHGESADRVIDRLSHGEKNGWKQALRVALHLTRALVFLHQRHVAHKNITPHNALIHSENDVAKLADTLLVDSLEGSVLHRNRLENKLLSELGYLAPEQIEPGAYVDDQCDQYGLGAVVYALLTGQPPFVGRKPEETLGLIRTALPEKPRLFNKAIPKEFQAIVLKMLAKHQEDRYATPTELLNDLDQVAVEHHIRV
jgi:serine/threonine protein kinase